jgi:hypothetical protein
MDRTQIISWLLDGDVSVQYQVHRDLLKTERSDLRNRIRSEGWGAEFLSRRNPSGHWGLDFYSPKWISSHYTLLDLKNLGISPGINEIEDTVRLIIKTRKGKDGGVNPSRIMRPSDVCVNGMFLNYASYFSCPEDDLRSVTDYILSQQLPDGGFNCNYRVKEGVSHSSLHTSLSVLEGISEYAINGYKYRLEELLRTERESAEFILQHKLFRSHRTGEIIDPKMLMLSWPSRWKYDILRALDYFRTAGAKYDERMSDAIGVLLSKRRKDGTWPLQQRYSGLIHFEMESCGMAGRQNSLRAMRVLDHFGITY